jgi:chromosome partitioning protein
MHIGVVIVTFGSKSRHVLSIRGTKNNTFYLLVFSDLNGMAYIITLSNGKGGVAKTTTSIALGGALSELGYRVLLIDLDPNANLTLGFKSFPEKPIEYSKDLFLSSRSHPIQPLKTGYPNLDLIPSDGYMPLLDKGSSDSDLSMRLLRHSLHALPPDSYDFILIDCPATLGFITINALTAANLLIIPTQSEFFSAYALQTMFSLVVGVRKKFNPNLKYRILVTQLDLHLRDHNNILNQLQIHLGESLYKTRIFIDPLLRDSQIEGIPITYARPNSTCALQYRRLAQEIINDSPANGQDHFEKSPVGSPAEKKTPVRLSQNLPTPAVNISTETASIKNGRGSNPNESSKLKSLPKQSLFPNSVSKGEATKKHTNSNCPNLGGIEDPQTMLAYPSSWNKCHLSKRILSPNLEHQNKYCISKNYASCPLLREQAEKSRSPFERSVMLQYLRNLIRAKSFE